MMFLYKEEENVTKSNKASSRIIDRSGRFTDKERYKYSVLASRNSTVEILTVKIRMM